MTVAFKTGDLVAGRFRITDELGKGAMGVVYKAHDASLDREVALKTIRFDVIADESDARDFRERFLREARTAARLAHPNIVTIFDVGEWEGVSYMAIEYLNGVTIHELLKPRLPLPVADCLRSAIQICRGLDDAHSHGIVHRDIKPANIMLVKNNQVKITDFGIAKVQSSATLTKEGAIVGTPSYMSPEQLSDKPVDGRSDIFATGAVLYEMLTGERAFAGENITTVILKVVTQQPEPARNRNPSLPKELDAVVERALQKDPARRYQTMAELAEDLEHIMAGVAPPTRAMVAAAAGQGLSFDVDPETEVVPVRGSHAALIGASIVALILVGIATALLYMVFKKQPPAQLPTPATPTPVVTAPATPTPTAPVLPAGPSVAVLPFESKGESGMDWLSSGLAQLFEADLAQSEKIHVVPLEDVVASAGELGIDLSQRLSSDSIHKIADAMGVRTILTGSYDVTGKVARFDVYLYEAESGKILVTDYEKADGDPAVLTGVDNLTIRVRDALGALPDAAAGDPDRDVAQVLTTDVDALKLYIDGRKALAAKDSLTALEKFKGATAKDPTFAAAHSKMSQTYAAMGRGELEEQARREAEAKKKAKEEEEAKVAVVLKQQEAQRLEEMRKRAEQRQAEEARQRQAAETESRRMAEAERRKAGLPPGPEGTPGADATPTPGATTPTPAAVTVREGDMVDLAQLTVQPRPISRADVQVSSALKRRGEQHGLIIISALVDQAGKVQDAKVLRSDIPIYNEAALESVKKWVFSPAEKDGVKVKTWFTVSMKL